MLIVNLNANVILEAKNKLIFSKTSILQQIFFFFFLNMVSWCWIPLIYLLTNCFYFVTVISTFDTVHLCFFGINLVVLLYLIKGLIALLELSRDTFTYIIKQIVRWNQEVSQIDIFTKKTRQFRQHNHTMSFFNSFESVLSSNTTSWRANLYYSKEV